jgi:hypothetical protein
VIFDKPGHPDQVPYIVTWQILVEDPPDWLKLLLLPRSPKPAILTLQEDEQWKNETKPSAPLYPVLQGGTEEYLLSLLPPRAGTPEPEGPGEAKAGLAPGVRSTPHTRRRAQRDQPKPLADSTVLPLRAIGPRNEAGDQQMQYWPFATSDLYNWKLQTPKFSEKPQGLIDLLDSVLFTHQPTWDDCQQLLQILFTTEERERIQTEARKLIPGEDGNPTTNQARIDKGFPLTRPNWDCDKVEGKERLRVYCQALMGGSPSGR